MGNEVDHARCVDAWLSRCSLDIPAARLVDLFEAALAAIWDRTKTTLGDVTLTAIAERVLHTAVEKFPMFAALEVEPNGGFAFLALRDQATSLDRVLLREGIRFVLIDFLTVLGNLTAEILTPELHAELSKVDLGDTTS